MWLCGDEGSLANTAIAHRGSYENVCHVVFAQHTYVPQNNNSNIFERRFSELELLVFMKKNVQILFFKLDKYFLN